MTARNALQRRRCASAIRAFPSTVLGPVDKPPWNRQRRFPGTTLMMHGAPARVLAQHLGRYLRFKGSPLGDRPRSSICRHQCLSRQVTSRHARPVLGQRTIVVIEANSMHVGSHCCPKCNTPSCMWAVIAVRNVIPHHARARTCRKVSRRLRMNPKNSNKNEDRLRAQSGSFQSPFYEFTTSRLSLNFCRL